MPAGRAIRLPQPERQTFGEEMPDDHETSLFGRLSLSPGGNYNKTSRLKKQVYY